MSNEFLSYEVAEGVAIITLRRTDVLNSFHRPMAAELQRSLASAADDESVRAVLLTAVGRAFSAGQDLAEAVPPGEGELPDVGDIVRDSYNPIIRALRSLPKPVVCAVNGVAAGAGANIAFACDFVLAAETASFIQAFTKIGLIPDSGGTFFLPRLVGPARAMSLMVLGEKLGADEAHRLGMIHDVVPESTLHDVAVAFAQRLAVMPTHAIALTKQAINANWTNDLDAQLELEERLQSEAGRSADYLEGVRAFQQKRSPVFKGK